MNALPDNQGSRPKSVMLAAWLGALAGSGTLFGAVYAVAAVFTSMGPPWFVAAAGVLAVVQVIAGVLLIVGAARLVAGRGRGLLVGGLVVELVVCATHWLHTMTVVTSDPDDAGVVPYFVAVAVGFTVVTVGCLLLVLRPSTRGFRSGEGRPRPALS